MIKRQFHRAADLVKGISHKHHQTVKIIPADTADHTAILGDGPIIAQYKIFVFSHLIRAEIPLIDAGDVGFNQLFAIDIEFAFLQFHRFARQTDDALDEERFPLAWIMEVMI